MNSNDKTDSTRPVEYINHMVKFQPIKGLFKKIINCGLKRITPENANLLISSVPISENLINPIVSVTPKITSSENDISTFIRCLFHDFRCPFNNISLGIDLLFHNMPQTEENNDIISSIKQSIAFMGDSLDGFLNVQNLKSNVCYNDVLDLIYEPFNIVGLVKNIQYILLFTILNKKVNIKYNINVSDEWVVGDKKHIQHVLMNLITNAVKYSHKNTTLKINLTSVKKAEETKKMFVIEIEDENEFISENIKNKLFEKYNTSDEKTGTGFGLFICKKIIEEHGGRIKYSAKTKGNVGNVFKIYLNLEVCASTNNNLQGSTSHESARLERKDTGILLKNRKLLEKMGEQLENSGQKIVVVKSEKRNMLNFVDIRQNSLREQPEIVYMNSLDNIEPDQEFVNKGCVPALSTKRDSVKKMFNKSKFSDRYVKFMVVDDSETSRKFMVKLIGNNCKNVKIIDATDGLDALVKIIKIDESDEKIGLMLVDNVMPNLTGEFLSKILRCIGYTGLLIGVTGNGLEEDVEKFLVNGADHVFTKPFTKAKLDKLLEFIQTNGYESKINHKIVEKSGKLIWSDNSST